VTSSAGTPLFYPIVRYLWPRRHRMETTRRFPRSCRPREPLAENGAVRDRGYSEFDGSLMGAELARWWGWRCGRSRRVGRGMAKGLGGVGTARCFPSGTMSNRRHWNNSEQLWMVIWFSVLLRPRYDCSQKWNRGPRVTQGNLEFFRSADISREPK
jgi:hypothetical protein